MSGYTLGRARYDTKEHEVSIDDDGRRLFHLEPPDAEDVANLERVALVWNSHDDLLEALKEAVGHLEALTSLEPRGVLDIDRARALAHESRAAIKRAEAAPA